MRTFAYLEPGLDDEPRQVQMTEDEILEQCWTWWSAGLLRLGKILEATPENCVLDWIDVHWADEV